MNELKRVFKETPAKLSLREFFNLSTAYEPGSEDFMKVFEVATMVYPDNETANLNAANAGDTPYAIYARGVLAGLRQEYSAAEEFFRKAAVAALEAEDLFLEEVAQNACDEMQKCNIINNK